MKKKWIDKRGVTYTVSVTDQETGSARGNVQFDVPSLEPRIEELYFAIKEKITNYLVQYREAQRAKSADIQRRSNQEVADRLRRYLDPEWRQNGAAAYGGDCESIKQRLFLYLKTRQ